MNFEIQNLRDTVHNRHVCREATEMYGVAHFKWELKEKTIHIEATDLDMDRFREFMHYLQ